MKIPAELNLNRDQAIELKRMTIEAGTDAAGIVRGIVQMYLSGRRAVVVRPTLVQLAEAVLAEHRPQARPATGRRPLLGETDVSHARLLRGAGETYKAIGEKFGVGESVVRRALKKA